ncbi:MAG: branched-chain amino acid ABC transporter ATP-binding protein/permease [Actinomycetota bacterium]
MAIAINPPYGRSVFARMRWLRWAAVIGFIIIPWVFPPEPWSDLAVSAAITALTLVSLVLLTGWVGQISLAQAAIMGVGAFTAAQVTNHLALDFPFHIIVAGAASAVVAVLIGLPALRIKGLYLAIATLAFQWMLQESLLNMHWFSGGFNGLSIKNPNLAQIDLSNTRWLYYPAWIITALVVLLVANLRDSKTGRAWFAIRGSEIAARSMGINVTRYKLLAFAISGFVIGIAGSLQLNLVGSATPIQYQFDKSILFLALAVIGGIGSLGGAVGISIIYLTVERWLVPTLSPALDHGGYLPLIAAGLLIFQLLTNPGGLASTVEKMKEDRLTHKRRKMARAGLSIDDSASTKAIVQRPQAAALHTSARTERSETPVVLAAEEVTVRFGGVVANDGISLEVRHGEICGLIGPNGAGKTTLFNTLNGIITPASGRIFFNGVDITQKPAHDRAALGMSRTFQLMKLFPRLTVYENVMTGTHLQNSAGFLSHMLQSKRSRHEDARLRERVREILDLLGISHLEKERAAGLPFGVLRLVELARALVASPSLLLLDEPASGLDVGETDSFAQHLIHIRDEMGPTILLIEHDMRLVMNVSDYVYVMDFGKNLFEGVPAVVQKDPGVIAAYLGGEKAVV